VSGRDGAWTEVATEEVSDALVAAMALGGVDYLFFTSGSEIMFWQEATAKAHALGRPSPRLLSVVHENVTLNAALGYVMVSGRPAATAVHVDLGTLSYGGGIHTAFRGWYPVLMTAGVGPRAYPGTARGARGGGPHFWLQEVRDQGEIVRQYVKWDHRLESQDNPGLIVSRALQVALSEPTGPVYLSVPRELAMQPLAVGRFPTVPQLGLPVTPAADPDAIRELAGWLVAAESPVIVCCRSGRNPAAVAALVRLAELLAIPVRDGPPWTDRLNFPFDHPLHRTAPPLAEADVVLVVEAQIPWIPGGDEPSPHARVVIIDADPIAGHIPTIEFTADLRLQADTAKALNQLYEAAAKRLMAADRRRIAARFERARRVKQAQWDEAERWALADGRAEVVTPTWLAYQLGHLVGDDAILLDDALSSSGLVQRYFRGRRPGTFFRSGGSAGGWGIGAALGAKLAAPDRDVVLAVGDGYYMFGVPYAALWSACRYGAPFLAVVFENGSYSTGTLGVEEFYPGGYAARAGFEGGYFEPAPDFAREAEAVGCYGERVTTPSEVEAALRRGLATTREGAPAVIVVRLPRLAVP
jgi:acetolactate synthase-1/2/3 large subunit